MAKTKEEANIRGTTAMVSREIIILKTKGASHKEIRGTSGEMAETFLLHNLELMGKVQILVMGRATQVKVKGFRRWSREICMESNQIMHL